MFEGYAVPLMPKGPLRYSPLAYRDPATSMLFYLESDGQHLSAIDHDGRLLWTKAWNMCPYRMAFPHIVSIKHARSSAGYLAATEKKWAWLGKVPVIRIYFDSSQFGLVNQRTGEFFFEGQN
jgi:hypothetical protein